MPQDAISKSEFKVVYGLPGDALYTDISGYASNVEPDGGERKSGEAYTFGEDTATITTGKRQPYDVNVTIVYTENPADLFEKARAAYENNEPICLAWSPKGGHYVVNGDTLTASDRWYAADYVKVLSLQYPQGDSASGDVLTASMRCRVSQIRTITNKVPKLAVGDTQDFFLVPPAPIE